MTTAAPFLCIGCKHRRTLETAEGIGGTCTAFPEGIPEAILEGADHRLPFPGDGEVRFELEPGFDDVVEVYDLLNGSELAEAADDDPAELAMPIPVTSSGPLPDDVIAISGWSFEETGGAEAFIEIRMPGAGGAPVVPVHLLAGESAGDTYARDIAVTDAYVSIEGAVTGSVFVRRRGLV